MAIELRVHGFTGPRFTNLEDASLSSLAKARRRRGNRGKFDPTLENPENQMLL